MLEIINYSQDTAREFDFAFELQDYLDKHDGDEIGVSNNQVVGSMQMALDYLELSKEHQARVQAIVDYHGSSYYDNIQQIIDTFDESIGMMFDGVNNERELAYKLTHELGLEVELNQILGCTEEAYESLASYIRDEDIAHTLSIEYNFVFIDSRAYEILN